MDTQAIEARRSRRALLTAAAAAGAAAVAGAAARPLTALAADGDDGTPLILGQSRQSFVTTFLTNGTTNTVLRVESTSSGTGIFGKSATGVGVHGYSLGGNAVLGESADGHGVEGYSGNSVGVVGSSKHASAVLGESSATDAPAVIGLARGGSAGVQGYAGAVTSPAVRPNTGVQGSADGTGTGGYFASPGGLAIRVQGRASFSRAGKASIPKNRSYVDVTVDGGLASTAAVVATLQTYRAGVWVAGVRLNYPSAGKARIYLNKVASTTTSTAVGWFVIG